MHIVRSAIIRLSQNYFALIKRCNVIRLQLARREIHRVSLAVQAFPAELSPRKYNISLRSQPFFAFDRSGREIISPSSRAARFHPAESTSTSILRNKLTVWQAWPRGGKKKTKLFSLFEPFVNINVKQSVWKSRRNVLPAVMRPCNFIKTRTKSAKDTNRAGVKI